jgi:hypothetical protein
MSFKLEMCSDLETGEKGRNNHKIPGRMLSLLRASRAGERAPTLKP